MGKNPRTTLRRSVQKLKELCAKACGDEEKPKKEESENNEIKDVHDMVEYINKTPLKKAVMRQEALSAKIRDE